MRYKIENFKHKTVEECIQAFATIPANIICLDLSNNQLGDKNGVELFEIFQALPLNIKLVIADDIHIDLDKFRNVHASLDDLHKRLGFQTEGDGCCSGVSLRWIEACLLDEEKIFEQRIKNIVADNNRLFFAINKIRERNINLTGNEKATPFPAYLLDILAFYDSLNLFQNADMHASLFSKYLTDNDFDGISYFASSDKIASHGGLATIYTEPGIYSKEEIGNYLKNLGEVIEKTTSISKEPVGIIIGNHDHRIALTCQADKGWKLMDINQYPSMFFEMKDTHLIAERIVAAFTTSYSPYIAFSTTAITLGKNLQIHELKCRLDQFKNSHVLTREMACRLGKNDNLAFIAARENDIDVIAKIAKYKVNLDTALANGFTPAMIAAQYGHVKVITELAKHNANLDIADKDGKTPIFMAASNGHANAVAELAIHNANLDKAHTNGATPAFVAAQEGHTNVIIELIKFGADFNLPYKASAYSLRNFASTHKKEIVCRMNQFILKQQLSSSTRDISLTPYDIAVIMGHNDIAQLITRKAPGSRPINKEHANSPGISYLEQKIITEITRLKAYKSNKGSFLVNIGVIEASDTKIKSLKDLRVIMQNGAAFGKNYDEFHNELRLWKKNSIATKNSYISSFFSPEPICVIEEIFTELGINDTNETLTPS